MYSYIFKNIGIAYPDTYNEKENRCINYSLVDNILSKTQLASYNKKCEHMITEAIPSRDSMFQKYNFIASKINIILNLPYHYNCIIVNCVDNSIDLNIASYLRLMHSKGITTFPIYVFFENMFNKLGHMTAFIINDDKLIVIDSSHATERLLCENNYGSLLNSIKIYINQFGFNISAITKASDIMDPIQCHEEKTIFFLNTNDRNGGNCSYWSYFLALFFIQNIKNINRRQLNILANYITKKTPLYNFINVFGNMMCEGYNQKIFINIFFGIIFITAITMFFILHIN